MISRESIITQHRLVVLDIRIRRWKIRDITYKTEKPKNEVVGFEGRETRCV